MKVQVFRDEFNKEKTKFALHVAVANAETEKSRKSQMAEMRRSERIIERKVKQTAQIATRLKSIAKKVKKSQKTSIKLSTVKTLISDMNRYVKSAQDDAKDAQKLRKERSARMKDTVTERSKLMDALFALSNATRDQLNDLVGSHIDTQNDAQPWLQAGFGGLYPPGGTSYPEPRSDPLFLNLEGSDCDASDADPSARGKAATQALAKIKEEERKQRKRPSAGFTHDENSKIYHYLLEQRKAQNTNFSVGNDTIEPFQLK